MKLILLFFVWIFSICESLIVPQELPSLLSLVYSTVPQIKKGTDSRFGFGFRLGEHADLQILVELGPQTETRPIGQSESSSLNNKRNVKQSDYVEIKDKAKQEPSMWLKNWSHEMRNNLNKTKQKNSLKASQISLNNEKSFNPSVQMVPLISEKALKDLQALYKVQHSLINKTDLLKKEIKN